MDADWVIASRAQVEDFRRRHRIGLVTLLFTDIIGSTQLKQRLGDATAIALIQQHHSVLRDVLRQFSEGQEIDAAGDSFFIVFAKPSDAVKFSLSVQAKLRVLAVETGRAIFDRIGIHVGEVFIDDAPSGTRSRDLFGLQVDTCARVMSLGHANQILLSRFAFDSARQVLRGEDIAGIGSLSWLNHGSYSLKGVDEPIEICEVGENREAVLSPPRDSEKAHRQVAAADEPVLGWRPAVGQMVPNTRWVLERSLGEGGFGEVWLGHHEILKDRRVFKFCFNAERVRSLKREVTIFRVLKENIGVHPNIVPIEDVFFDEPPFYIVMEYVEGDNLSDWCKAKGGCATIPIGVRLELIAQIGDALQAAHESGVIHRDVKPQNILIHQPNGAPNAKLTDFGIGKVVSQEVLSGITRLGFTQTLDSTGRQSGTQMYMAPETIAGHPATTRSDIYSLGVVLYQLLVDDFSRPVTTDWEEEVKDRLLCDDLRCCFARDPDKRFAAAKQLVDNLRSLQARHGALEAQKAAAVARERTSYRRGVIRTAAIALLILSLVAGLAIFGFVQAQRATRSRDEARATLSQSYFLQAIRSADENRAAEAAAQLVRSLSENPNNDAAASYLLALLAGHDFSLASLQLNHAGPVRSARFSPDGKRILTSSYDNTARVWDAQTGRALITPLTDAGGGCPAMFSRDGNRIVTGSKTIARVWDARNGKALTAPLRHDGEVQSVQFAPNGQRVVTASAEKAARVWAVDTGEQLEGLQHDEEVGSAEFSPDGQQILTASRDGKARIWDVPSGRLLTELLKNEGLLHSAQFSPDGKRILTSSYDNTARVWDAQSGKSLTEPLKHNEFVSSAQFSPDGKRIATASYDSTARIWDAQTGQALTEPLKHDRQVNSAQFSPDGKRIVTASGDKTVRLWDSKSGKQLAEPMMHGGLVWSAEFSPDGKRIVTASVDTSARVWGAQPGKQIVAPLKHDGAVTCAEFSPDGTEIITASQDKTARLWDAQRGKLLNAFQHDEPVSLAKFSPDGKRIVTASGKAVRVWDAQNSMQPSVTLKDTFVVTSAEFSPDGAWILTTSFGPNSARLWDAKSGKLMKTLQHDNIVSAEFSSDGKRIVTASEDATARVWDVQSGRQVTEPLKHNGVVSDAHFSSNGKWIVTASGKTVRVWDTQSGKQLTGPLNQNDFVFSAQFSSDGKWIVTTSESKIARVWDAQTGKLLEALQAVSSARFSPDGERIVTVSPDKSARVWDVDGGKLLAEPLRHNGLIYAATFSPNGHQVVTASEDNTARVWDIPPPVKVIPQWLPRLAGAAAGQRLNDLGSFEAITEDESKVLNQIREELSKTPADDESATWGRWFLADRSTRTISPYSKITIPEYIENRIKENTQASLDEAEDLALGSERLLKRIASARENLMTEPKPISTKP